MIAPQIIIGIVVTPKRASDAIKNVHQSITAKYIFRCIIVLKKYGFPSVARKNSPDPLTYFDFHLALNTPNDVV